MRSKIVLPIIFAPMLMAQPIRGGGGGLPVNNPTFTGTITGPQSIISGVTTSAPVVVTSNVSPSAVSVACAPTCSGHYLTVSIDGTGTPDTFVWQIDSGSATSGVGITGAAQVLGTSGFTVTFSATTGHALNDTWFSAQKPGIVAPELSRLWIGSLPQLMTGSIGSPDLMVTNTGDSHGQFGGSTWLIEGNGTGYDWQYYSSEGTPSAPTTLTAGDYIAFESFNGHDGTNYNTGAFRLTWVDGTPTLGNTPIAHCIQAGNSGLDQRANGNIGIINGVFGCLNNSEDIGFRRAAAGVFEVNNGTPGTLAILQSSSGSQIGATSTDPACTAAGDIGKLWFDNTTNTTAFKVCKSVSGTVGWSTVTTVP